MSLKDKTQLTLSHFILNYGIILCFLESRNSYNKMHHLFQVKLPLFSICSFMYPTCHLFSRLPLFYPQPPFVGNYSLTPQAIEEAIQEAVFPETTVMHQDPSTLAQE